MAGVSAVKPILPVDWMAEPEDDKRQLAIVDLAAGATFPADALVLVNGSGQATDYVAGSTDPIAVSEEAANDMVNLEAGPQLFAASKNNVYVHLIKGRKLVMTASWTGGSPVILDPSHIGQQFEAAIDPNSGNTFIDLTTAGSGPFTILGVYECPDCPAPFNTTISALKRRNARVIVAVDPAREYVA